MPKPASFITARGKLIVGPIRKIIKGPGDGQILHMGKSSPFEITAADERVQRRKDQRKRLRKERRR